MGQQLPVMSLDNYKNDLKSYTDSEVTTQLNQAKDNLENAFSKYADKLNSGALTSIKANTTMIGTVSKHVNDIVGQWSSKNYSNSDLNMWMKDSKNNVLSLLPDGCYGFNGYVDTLMKTTDFSPECVGLTV